VGWGGEAREKEEWQCRGGLTEEVVSNKCCGEGIKKEGRCTLVHSYPVTTPSSMDKSYPLKGCRGLEGVEDSAGVVHRANVFNRLGQHIPVHPSSIL